MTPIGQLVRAIPKQARAGFESSWSRKVGYCVAVVLKNGQKKIWEKLVKNTRTICWQFTNKFFGCVSPFCGIGAERIKNTLMW